VRPPLEHAKEQSNARNQLGETLTQIWLLLLLPQAADVVAAWLLPLVPDVAHLLLLVRFPEHMHA